MSHLATPAFWKHYSDLPPATQRLSDAAFALLAENPRHPSLHFKRVGPYWSARVSLSVRALAVAHEGDFVWFWIGDHADYDRLIK